MAYLFQVGYLLIMRIVTLYTSWLVVWLDQVMCVVMMHGSCPVHRGSLTVFLNKHKQQDREPPPSCQLLCGAFHWVFFFLYRAWLTGGAKSQPCQSTLSIVTSLIWPFRIFVSILEDLFRRPPGDVWSAEAGVRMHEAMEVKLKGIRFLFSGFMGGWTHAVKFDKRLPCESENKWFGSVFRQISPKTYYQSSSYCCLKVVQQCL